MQQYVLGDPNPHGISELAYEYLLDGEPICIQAITFLLSRTNSLSTGQVIFLGSINNPIWHRLWNNEKHTIQFVTKAKDKFVDYADFTFKDVTFESAEGGMTVDDIVHEVKVNFTFSF